MIDPSEALTRIVSGLPLSGTETVSLMEAAGRITAAPVLARLSNPPADVSAMDGYAVRAADTTAGAELRITGEAPAGHPSAETVTAGSCVRIFTGSVIPDGADAVLIQENTTRDGDRLTVTQPVTSGRFIRARGQDFTCGQPVIPAGKRLSARDIGLAAAANCPWITVRRRPRVAILSTGDEICLPGDSVPPGSIIGSAAFMLGALLKEAGADPVILPVAKDTAGDIRQAATGLATTDMLLTIGGASVGDYDLVKAALGEAGLVTDFWKIAMRPGKPLMFGHLGDTPVIGLPGNPVAAFVCGIVFVLPALRGMSGETPSGDNGREKARLACDLPANDLRFDHLRAALTRDENGILLATPFPKQDSGMISPLATGDALILRDAHAPAAKAGEICDIIRFGHRDD
ncbi:molybdopterin molybdotransferase MoeA [Acetobacter oeni]|uniref:Molybdopterin molybdenumtransferase n=1 Tax=Acetobacter oeni TaxID=304077 RepID=A0A511XK19_9PROT|nr:gephyrin-like molybdotransferase Glp [Acetobacter oeni]MBB3883113.1 molybdopterin molybdotransferase [Acetobacter oeni]NHO19247.1 molybdopterin molybdenumtransferase MoeA [Acetobacter oeni]GBR07069.1 molybdopterin biosynthesis protein MoeA [Acetobacter oeni LMG 21952]GEN63293.1 molybdopterin molybdenumtransferase MoeA [Acetobacter oeni]